MKINTVVLVVLFITHGSPFMLLYVCLSVLVGTYVLFLSPCFKPPPTCFKLISVVPFFFFFFQGPGINGGQLSFVYASQLTFI